MPRTGKAMQTLAPDSNGVLARLGMGRISIASPNSAVGSTRIGPLRSLSLRYSLLLLVTGTIVALTLLTLVCVFGIVQRVANDAIARDFRATGTFLTEYLQERARSTAATCRVMGTQPTVIGYLFHSSSDAALKDWPTVSDIAEDVRVALGADMLVITDQRGRVVGRGPVVPYSRIEEASEAEHPIGTEVWQGIVTEGTTPALAVQIPITAPGTNYVRGSFYALYHLNNKLASSLRDVIGREVAIIHKGRVIAASVPMARDARPTLSQVIGPDSSSNVVYSESGERFLGAFQNVHVFNNRSSLGVLLLQSERESAVLYGDLRYGLFSSAILVLALSVALGILVSHRVTQPLESVVQAARQIKDGKWPEQFPTDRNDEIGLLQSAFNDMTSAVRSAQERLLARIDTDPLTDLDNHRRFKERLVHEVQRAETSGEPLTLLLIDVDQFRQLNEQFGLSAGDDALRYLAQILTEVAPPGAITARFGGDEFALILTRTSTQQADRTVGNLHRELSEKLNELFSLSIGYAVYRPENAEPETLLIEAEFALAQAKHVGGNRTYRFDPARANGGEGGREDLSAGVLSEPGDLQYLHRFLRDGSLVAIQALAAAVDAKDEYTQGHSRRVAELSALLAHRIDLSREEIDRVYTSAILHDVGKIGVPDQLLKKQSFLDAEEIRMMQAHPILGEIIISKVPQLASAAAGVRWHHERWDGKGYPDGLKEQEIPLVARIIALADTFDAMTTDRPYRPGLDPETVLDEIAKNAGSQFAPDLVPAFISVIGERLGIRRSSTASNLRELHSETAPVLPSQCD